jgi:hypothetical protein
MRSPNRTNGRVLLRYSEMTRRCRRRASGLLLLTGDGRIVMAVQWCLDVLPRWSEITRVLPSAEPSTEFGACRVLSMPDRLTPQISSATWWYCRTRSLLQGKSYLSGKLGTNFSPSPSQGAERWRVFRTRKHLPDVGKYWTLRLTDVACLLGSPLFACCC